MSSKYQHQAFAAVTHPELERAAGCCTLAREEVETRPARRELPLRRPAPQPREKATCC